MTPCGKTTQRGLVLLLSLTLVLLLGLLGISAMGSATQQERMARNLLTTLQMFEQAHQVLQQGELRALEQVGSRCEFCLPPPEAGFITRAGVHAGAGASSGLVWLAGDGGFYLIQSLGESTQARRMPPGLAVNLYRVTAVARNGMARSVLESVIAQPVGPAPQPWRRILWRQIY
ncbi:pilus assembly PilX family protein [Pseudomonas sp.]|uniref:pilus assembly PilX family protein n=1 Tax=Pseudomonas sp. TaxID=306 RepID=UPI003D6F06C7